MKRFTGLVLIIMCLTSSVVFAAGTINIPKVERAPLLDGSISEGEWVNAHTFDRFYQVLPGDNAQPSERTIMYMMYDNDKIYIAAQCYVTDKSTIKNFHCQRDDLSSTDRIFLFFDTFNTKEKSYVFVVNVNNEQADGVFTINGQDNSVNMPFQSAAAMTDYGYNIEFAIPLKSLSFNAGDNAKWGVFFRRFIADSSEEVTPFPVDRSSLSYFSNYQTIEFSHLPSQQNLTVLASVISDHKLNEDDISGFSDRETKIDPEMTVTYEPMTGATITATINPDFSTVEADSLTMTVNARYPVYYPELRPFFIERTNPFTAPFTAFHTRQIVNPIWGSKVSIRKNKWSVFALAAQDQDAPADRFYDSMTGDDDAYFAFSHIGYQLSGDGSFVRASTAVRSFRGYENFLSSLDTVLVSGQNFRMLGQYVFSGTEMPDAEKQYGDGYFLNAQYTTETYSVSVATRGITAELRDDLGYIPRVDVQKYQFLTQYFYNAAKDTDTVRSISATFDTLHSFNYGGGIKEDWYFTGSTDISFSNNMGVNFGHRENMDLFAGKENLMQNWWGQLYVNTYTSVGGAFFISRGVGLWYNPSLPIRDDYTQYSLSTFVKPSQWMTLTFNGTYESIETAYSATIYEARLRLQFNKSFIFRTIAQYSEVSYDPYGMSAQSLNIYPLFIYQPNVHFSIYAGMTYAGDDMKIMEYSLAEQKNKEWFFKISYAMDVL